MIFRHRKKPEGFKNINLNNAELKIKEQKALELFKLSKFKTAENLYKELIKIGYINSIIFNNLAFIISREGKTYEVIDLLKESLKIDSKNVDTLNNLGVAFNNIDDTKNAIFFLEKGIKIQPNFPDLYNNIGFSFVKEGKIKKAIKYFYKAIELNPNFYRAFFNIGNAYEEINNLVKAKEFILKSLRIKGDYEKAYLKLAKINQRLNDDEAALDIYSEILKTKRNDASIYNNIGVIYGKKGNLNKAKLFFDKAISINKNYEITYLNYSQFYIENNNYLDAIMLYDIAFKLNKNIDIYIKLASTKRYICDWSTFEKDYCYVKNNENLIKSVQPRNIQFLFDNPSLTLKVSKKYFIDKFLRKEENIKYKEKSKIKIGYFSADFYNHPVTLLISQILKEHNRNIFEIYAYSFGVRLEDKYTEEIKNNVDHFKDLKDLNDIQAVELVRKDGIDIAIDLMGYTEYCRTSIFSMRIAPIQINYLGFSGSMASNCMDYIIADKTLIPKQDRNFYTEKIIYLNQSAICCNDSMRKEGKYFKRSDFNLPENDFLFACFNNNYKITPKEFNIWMRLLKIVKNSRILLKISNKNAKLNLIKEAKLREIDSDRLIFTDHLTLEKHLERHTKIDLFLDTFNYNAGSTAVFSLLSGVPILTKYGRSYQSRMSSSLLEHLGLKELITKDEQEYENKALLLATNPERLKSIKHKLRDALDRKRTLNSKYFVKELEEHLKYLICKIKKINSD